MLLTDRKINHISAVSHDGKLVCLGTDPDGLLWYSIKRAGFEDSALSSPQDPFGFEAWKQLPLDGAADDPSVRAFEAANLTDQNNNPLLRSVYGTGDDVMKTVQAPVQLISGLGHVYVFRQSAITNRILVSRFVLDGLLNELVPKLDVRFRRSRKRLEPQPPSGSNAAALAQADGLDYRDIDGTPFHEPAIELSFVPPIQNGWFAVALVPTSAGDQRRWHVFAHDPARQKVCLYSVASSGEGLFEIKDQIAGAKGPEGMSYRTVPGIVERSIDLQGLTVAGRPAATAYDVQSERQTKLGVQLVRDALRLMLVVPVREAGATVTTAAAVSFAVAADGMLSQVDLTPDSIDTLRSHARDVILPLTELDDIKVLGQANPPPAGVIAGMRRGSSDRVELRSTDAVGGVATNDKVRLYGTRSYDGQYTVTSVNEDTFEVDAGFSGSEPGYWEVVPAKETGLTFDNMVLGFEKSAGGNLRVRCASHDLKIGDQVQLIGTDNADGMYTVKVVAADKLGYTLDAPWKVSEAANLMVIKHRGLVFDGVDDMLETPALDLAVSPGPRGRFGRTISLWIKVNALASRAQCLVGGENELLSLVMGADNRVAVETRLSDGTTRSVVDPDPVTAGTWYHYAGTVDYDPATAGETQVHLCKNGVKVTPATVDATETVRDKSKFVACDAPPHLREEALVFDGSDDFLQVPASGAGFGKGITIEAWVYLDSSGQASDMRGIFTESLGAGVATVQFALHLVGAQHQLQAGFYDGKAWWKVASSGGLPLKRWVHVAATYDNHIVQLFIDGVPDNKSVDFNLALPPAGAPWRIGRRHDVGLAASMWKGRIADVRLWNAARSAGDIRSAMFQALAGTEPSLCGHWPLGNRSLSDRSPRKRHATALGAPVWSVQPFRFPAPAMAGALAFNSDADSVDIADPGIAGKSFTLSFWAKRFTSTGAPELILCQGPEGTNTALHIGFRATGQITFAFYGNDLDTPLAYKDNRWHHYSFTYDAVTRCRAIYRDGEKVVSDVATAQLASSGKLRVGRTTWSGPYRFSGCVAELCLWDRALSADEAKVEVFRPVLGNDPGLLGYWPMDSGQAHDAGPRRAHGQLNGQPTAYGLHHFIAGLREGGPVRCFAGEMSEARIWDRALSERETRDTMNLTITGKENGIAAYYRMGAVVPGSPAIVPDFTPQSRHATVHGEPHGGARTLNRVTFAGAKAVKYSNPALVAVRQMATYEESFDFRILGPNPGLDPNNVDGQGNRLFSFSVWGKSSAQSESVIQLPAGCVQQIDFEKLAGGDHRATCRITVPEGVSMLRVFEIADVRGAWTSGVTPPANEWTAIEMRRHKLRLVSDAISREVYTDDIAPAKLASADVSDAVLRDAEIRIAKHKGEITSLVERLEFAKNTARYEAEKSALGSQITSLRAQYSTAESALARERVNLKNYYFRLKNRGTNKTLGSYSGPDGDYFVYGGDGYGGDETDGTGFQLLPRDGEWSFLTDQHGDAPRVMGARTLVNGSPIYKCPRTGENEEDRLWKLVEGSPGEYQIVNKRQAKRLDVGSQLRSTVHAIVLWDNTNQSTQRWTAHDRQLTLAGTQAIAAQERAVDDLRKAMRDREDRLTYLNKFPATTEIPATLQALLDAARANLAAAQLDFASENTKLLALIAKMGAGLSMTAVQRDDRGLRTDAALLDFVRPIGGLHIAATSEGNVQLDYVDPRGRLCSTLYDAAADSRNTSFEQWLPDVPRPCVEVANSGSVLTPTEPLVLPAQGFTFETWFQYPLATKEDGTAYPRNVFAGSADGLSSPVCISRGDRLGVLVDGVFFDSGVRLGSELVAGWHHLAAVGQQGGTSFYLNGALAGSVQATRRVAVLDGVDDFIEMPGSGATFAQGLTVEAWVQLKTPMQPSEARGICTAVQAAGTSTVQFNLSATGADHKLQAGFLDGGTWRTVISPAGLPCDRWVHVAATYDNRFVRLYIDGALAATSSDFNRALPAPATQWRIGRRHDAGTIPSMWTGKISEVRLWDRVLGDYEVRDGMSRPLAGSESNLVGYWAMEAFDDGSVTKVKDRSSKAKHGTVLGGHQVEVMVSQCGAPLTAIGNMPGGGSPAGRLCEVALWSATLNAAEIESMSKMRSSGFEPGLVGFWPLSEASGPTAFDRCGSNHLTLVAVDRVVCSAPIGSPVNVRKPNVSTHGGDPAMAFDGAAGQVGIQGIDLAKKSFTIEFWAQRPRLGTTDYLVSQGGKDAANFLAVVFLKDNSLILSRAGVGMKTGALGDSAWHHWACVYDATAQMQRIYRDGQLDVEQQTTADYQGTGELSLSRSGSKVNMAELRVWGGARTEQQIADNMRARLTGGETGLLGCWPLSSIETGNITRDLSPAKRDGAVSGGVSIVRSSEPLIATTEPPDEILTTAVMAVDYPTISVSPAGVKEAIMRRCLGFVQDGQARFLYDARVEALAVQWIGNAQFKPTLLGYIEGPPPVPSENLTLQEDYAGATSVQLVQSENVDYSWQRSDSNHRAFDMDAFIGAAWGVEGGLGIITKISEGKAGGQFRYHTRQGTSRSSAVHAASTLAMSDSIALRGAVEDAAAFPHLGRRFLPKNVGYALVISGLADVFVTKLARSGRMIGYDIKPVEGIPLDVNTITFMLNPTYTLNGSLDGMVGSFPADARFYDHVPAMRAQYGSLYPASYYRLQEAYDLAAEIERRDKARETYFLNFDATNVNAAMPDAEGEVGEYGSGVDDGAGDSEDGKAANASGAKEDAKAQSEEKKKEAEKRKAAIKSQIAGIDGQVRAMGAFAEWQTRMENILVKAGKRNIVNKYVWDADGGLRSETQSFSSSVEHTLGGDVEHEGGGGGVVDAQIAAFKLELSLIGSGGNNKSAEKGLNVEKSLELSVDLAGLESRGITRLDDTPCMPGEKVDRYRFMTFYLEPETKHFDDFFRTVVDPEWLISNDEEARALRQVAAGKANRCWRVMHRVTYVERPALMGFGRDVRALPAGGGGDRQMSDYFEGLESKQRLLGARIDGIEGKLDEILIKLP